MVKVKQVKRLLALVLVLATLMTALPMTAMAANYEYAWFPAPAMNLTQLAYESYSHGSCNAIDIAPGGTVFAPFTGKIVYKDANWGYVLFQSTDKVYYADGTLDYMTVGFMHDSNISDLSVGQIIKQGTGFYHAGGMGNGNPYAYGAHVDISVMKGRVNSVTKYGRGDVYAYNAFYINSAKTTSIINKGKMESGNYMTNGAPSNWSNLWKNLGAVTPTKPTISGENYPSTISKGNVFSIYGTISANSPITKVVIGVYDVNGNKAISEASATPNSNSYNIHSLDNYVYFNKLNPGVYNYKISATNSAGTQTWSKTFVVLATSNTITPGTYRIQPSTNTAYSIGIAGNSKKSGANVELQQKANSTYQVFIIQSVGGGYYTIKNYATGLYLDVSGAYSASGTNIQQYTQNSTSAQKWQILPTGNAYCLVPQCGTANCLDIRGGTMTAGTNVWTYTANLSVAQCLKLTKTTVISSTLSTPKITAIENVVKGTSGIKLNWGKVTGAATYEVYRKKHSQSNWTKIATVKGTSYTDASVRWMSGTMYDYSVVAVNGSARSNKASTKTILRMASPAMRGLTNNASRTIRPTWSRNKAADGYQIWYQVGENASTRKIITVYGSGTVSRNITGLTKGNRYKVFVRSFKKVNGVYYYSAWSASRTVKVSK